MDIVYDRFGSIPILFRSVDWASPDSGSLTFFGILFPICGKNENIDNIRPGFVLFLWDFSSVQV